MTSVLNKAAIEGLPIPEKDNRVHYFRGAKLQGGEVPSGFGVRVTANGAKAFVLNYRAGGTERRYTIGDTASWSVLDAVKRARELRQQVARGEDPQGAKAEARPKPIEQPKTVADVLDQFIDRATKSDAKGNVRLRRPDHYVDAFNRLVKPVIGAVAISELRRRHIIELLDRIEDNNGPVMATRSLAYLQSALNWYATRDEEFVSPIVRGMARSNAAERARDRTLTDDEIRTLWPVFGECRNFGKACRFMLLTGARLSEALDMPWSEISEDGATWAIPACRYKTKRDQIFPLSAAAQAIVAGQPPKGSRVFPSRRYGVRVSPSHEKRQIDKLAPGLDHWTIHDLRRTARTLLSRAGVRPDVAARVLGHVSGGDVDTRVYDRYAYLDEKRDAVEKLAGMIERILNPDAAVVPLRRA